MGDVCETKSPAPCPARFILQSNVVLGYQVWEMLARKPFADVSNVHKQEVKAIPEETPISSICPFIVILDQIGATGLE